MGKGRSAIDNNVILDALGALIVLVTLLSGRRPKREGASETRVIRALMICCVAALVTDIPGLLLDGSRFPGARALLWLFDTVYWLLHIVYCWLWAVFAAVWNRKPAARFRRKAWLYAPPMLCEILLILTTPFTGWLFALDEANRYVPGSAYRLCLLPYYLYVAISLLVTARGCFARGDAERRRRSQSMLAYMFLPACGMAMELVAYGVSWVWPLIALSLLMAYLGIQQQTLLGERLAAARAAETSARLEAEMTNSRMAIMVSQIQPHFLYNALCVIQDLCHDKAPEAEAATVAFSRFLRGNLDSLGADKPIPFAQELSHTRYYLALEKMRFGDRLRVSYDLKADLFRMPALTLQPLVENAVRYGVMSKASGGAVRIASFETPDAYVVTVTDDGAGYDPARARKDGRTHVGIENVLHRLREMCAGNLTITSEPGLGTVATITLPKEVGTHANLGA